MYRLLYKDHLDNQHLFYFKNKSTLLDFLDDNIPSDEVSGMLRHFEIRCD